VGAVGAGFIDGIARVGTGIVSPPWTDPSDDVSGRDKKYFG
jgi:hypothetical protein